MLPKRYLGDAVYVQFDGLHIILTTSDGYRDTNKIYLEEGVVDRFLNFIQDLRLEQEEQAGQNQAG